MCVWEGDGKGKKKKERKEKKILVNSSVISILLLARSEQLQ